MLQLLWHFLSSFLPSAGCQGSREGTSNEVRGTPAPARGDQMSSFLGKQDGRAEATEKRPTILLVVGPAEQFPKVMATSRTSYFRGWSRIGFLEKTGVWGGREELEINQFGIRGWAEVLDNEEA